jgi:hypothetical protein
VKRERERDPEPKKRLSERERERITRTGGFLELHLALFVVA